MIDDKRYCEYFKMSPKQLQDYKEWKTMRIIIYIVLMTVVTLFKARITGYIFFTGYLIMTTSQEKKCEEQWIKDGAITREQIK